MITNAARSALWLAVFVGLIVVANVATNRLGLVPAGFGLLVTAGTYAAGLALLARDFLHRAGGIPWVLSGILVGVVLSWILTTPALAAASAAAFALSELADLLAYVLVPGGFIVAAAVSNLISAPVDTFAFLALAGFPITTQTVAGQLLVKLLWGTAAPLLAYGVLTRWNTSRTLRPRRSGQR